MIAVPSAEASISEQARNSLPDEYTASTARKWFGGHRSSGQPRETCYLLLRFPPAASFLPAAFFATFAVFLGDFFALFLPAFLVDDELLPPEKILSQLSEYCLVAPTRTTLMAQVAPEKCADEWMAR
jgi:hypothetical protein